MSEAASGSGITDRPAEGVETPSDAIAAALRRAILEHRVSPGAKLSEDEVGQIFGAGRTVVRTALQTLAHQGLVTIRRNRGAFVAEPSIREAREVFEARALLEPRTARSAAERTGPADVARLHRHLSDEHRAVAAGDLGLGVYLSGQFHIRIAEIADQDTIAGFIRALVARSSLIIALYWLRRDTTCESHAHEALVEALAARDGARAEDLMRGHLVDLVSGLDLRPPRGTVRPLSEVLVRPDTSSG